MLTDRGVELETSTLQQAFEPSICVCSSSGQSNPFAEGVHGREPFERSKVGAAAEEVARLGPGELAIHLSEPLGEQIGIRVAQSDPVRIQRHARRCELAGEVAGRIGERFQIEGRVACKRQTCRKPLAPSSRSTGALVVVGN